MSLESEYSGNGAANPSLKPELWRYRPPSDIPPRPWLLGNVLLRGYATLLGAAGGTGKTAWAVAASLAVITGQRRITGLHPFTTGNVWFITLEDDRLELERRFAAAIIAHNLDPTAIEGRLFINAGPLKLAEYVAVGHGRGSVVRAQSTPDAAEIASYIKENNIVLTVLDPFVKAHALDGNRTEDMDEVMRIANELTHSTGSALLLPAHFRKGAGEEDGQAAFRGASSQIDAARLAYMMLPMGKDEAQDVGLEEDQRGAFIRMVNAKANMTPKALAGDWYQLHDVSIGNGGHDAAYPEGDHVQAVIPWCPAPLLDGIDHMAMKTIFETWEKGPGDGLAYSPVKQSKQWGGYVIVDVTHKNDRQASAIMKKWEENGVFQREHYRTPDSHNDVQRIILNRPKANAMMSAIQPIA